ncbi:uncharacterized protein M421DRAFT_181619 [Didymella exigua CBS 183.55]|uniref:Uncharacterized protein n=1 Tax=Didymella exigua CBS 183.55 TaxID=1150837 RepID=A0A6A5RJE6_9PLEO|nr:uncharacterized protein M421DRAFT_181619 [Didymella exigua CBS 183.55]KAF1927094.1 hypothetical protein M421DRAFT_181619 [Didymella exigua CBS 183.55]
MTGSPTFRADELHTLQESTAFHIDANKIPTDICCSCLQGGRFCLSGTHWLLEYGPNSDFWLDEHGKPRKSSLIQYTGKKQGNHSVVINNEGDRICCVEGLAIAAPESTSPKESWLSFWGKSLGWIWTLKIFVMARRNREGLAEYTARSYYQAGRH